MFPNTFSLTHTYPPSDNEAGAPSCHVCGTSNPKSPGVTVSHECTKCHHLNSEFSTKCGICDSPLYGTSKKRTGEGRRGRGQDGFRSGAGRSGAFGFSEVSDDDSANSFPKLRPNLFRS